jgi:hypothetical protein
MTMLELKSKVDLAIIELYLDGELQRLSVARAIDVN